MKLLTTFLFILTAFLAIPAPGSTPQQEPGRIKLYFFGTASGSQPIMGRRHAALALEYNNVITWLDAGEGCSHTASEMGHNHADAIARELRQRGTTVKELIYVHHGHRICKNPERELVRAEKAWGKSVIFSCDKMVVVL